MKEARWKEPVCFIGLGKGYEFRIRHAIDGTFIVNIVINHVILGSCKMNLAPPFCFTVNGYNWEELYVM
jgi:hypothetical protein